MPSTLREGWDVVGASREGGAEPAGLSEGGAEPAGLPREAGTSVVGGTHAYAGGDCEGEEEKTAYFVVIGAAPKT